MKLYTILFIAILFTLGERAAARDETEFTDGRYIGRTGMVDVVVVIEKGKIEKIEILKHRGGGQKYLDMVKPLVNQIVEKQSTQVDAVTGATVSSEALKKAVQNALEKAER